MSPKPAPEPEEVRRARMLREMDTYEQAHPDMIPGSASHDGKRATGGRYYADAARMAKARQLSGGTLNDQDRRALELHPEPNENATCEADARRVPADHLAAEPNRRGGWMTAAWEGDAWCEQHRPDTPQRTWAERGSAAVVMEAERRFHHDAEFHARVHTAALVTDQAAAATEGRGLSRLRLAAAVALVLAEDPT